MLRRRRDEKPVIDLRRLRCAGPCACGGALVVLMVLPLRFILASQAGLVAGWRAGAMPSSMLARPVATAPSASTVKPSLFLLPTPRQILSEHLKPSPKARAQPHYAAQTLSIPAQA